MTERKHWVAMGGDTAGQTAYRAWCAYTKITPEWNTMPVSQCAAWEVAAKAVIDRWGPLIISQERLDIEYGVSEPVTVSTVEVLHTLPVDDVGTPGV